MREITELCTNFDNGYCKLTNRPCKVVLNYDETCNDYHIKTDTN